MLVVADRRYQMSFPGKGPEVFVLSAQEVRRLVDAYPVLSVRPYRLVLQGADAIPVTLQPTNLGGGEAFVKVTHG